MVKILCVLKAEYRNKIIFYLVSLGMAFLQSSADMEPVVPSNSTVKARGIAQMFG